MKIPSQTVLALLRYRYLHPAPPPSMGINSVLGWLLNNFTVSRIGIIFCFFNQKNSIGIIKFWKLFQIAAKTWKKKQNFKQTKQNKTKKQKKTNIARILCNFTPYDPLFWICHQMTPFFARKLSLYSPLFWCISRRTPTFFFYMWVPPGGFPSTGNHSLKNKISDLWSHWRVIKGRGIDCKCIW